jgi:ADP-glucose pyrophosphorylase
MEEVNKNAELDNTDKKLHISDVISSKIMDDNKEKKFTKLDMFNFAEHCMVKLLSKYNENGMGEISSYDLTRIREVLRNFTKTE